MALEKSLKDENKWTLWGYIAVQAVVLFIFLTGWPFSESILSKIAENKTILLMPGSLTLATVAIFSLLLSGVFTANVKARMVYWKWNNPLPGSRAFTELGKTDPRIDLFSLEKKYGPLPTDPIEQNQLWYQLYKSVRDTVGVRDAHRSYLVLRELCVYTVILGFLATVFVHYIHQDWGLTWCYLLSELALYMLMSLSGRNFGVRLVLNVLAEVTQDIISNKERGEPRVRKIIDSTPFF